MLKKNEKLNFGLILTVYLLGIFMGALDTGIVTPARTIIQDSLGVDEKIGIWMITIYTLAYAASIPVMGKLADRMGRRTIYLISIFMFGAGSLMCGLSHEMESFTMLLVSRAIQAIGGGGIMPVATAEFGTTFPEEKRGMALGMVGGVYGIANIFGASAGSGIMDIFGADRWEYIFYVNVPIALFILIAGAFALPNTKEKSSKPIDGLGIGVLVMMILSLLYGLKNIDFFEFKDTLVEPEVYWFIAAFFLLLPFFIIIERRAEDPVMNLKYFANPRIIMTLCVTVISGIVMMGLIFIPQFCENALKLPSGNGGYFVIILGVCAGVGSMSSGKMTDKLGPKIVLSIGLVAAIIGSLIVVLFACEEPSRLNVFAGLIFIGLGIGFTMGAPLNYMMLGEVDEKESNSALATLSLVRSLGTVVAPAIMVGFIAHAAAGISDNIMDIMPSEVNVPKLPYAEELMLEMEEQEVEGMPDLSSIETMEIKMGEAGGEDSDFALPDELLQELQNSDVTTITASVKHMAAYFFEEMVPDIEKEINDGLEKGIDGISEGIEEMDAAIAEMEEAKAGMNKGIRGMNDAISKQRAAKEKLITGRAQLTEASEGLTQALNGLNAQYEIEVNKTDEEPDVKAQKLAMITAQMNGMEEKQAELQASIQQMTLGIEPLETVISKVELERKTLQSQEGEMEIALEEIKEGREEALKTLNKMQILKEAIPGAFETAGEDYLKKIDGKQEEIEGVYQDTLNGGFRQIFIMTAIGSIFGLVALALYRKKK